MLTEFLIHLVTLDFPWVISFIMNNLFFVFAFAIVSYGFFGKGKIIKGALVLTLAIWSALDFTTLTGWTVVAGGFLGLMYLTRLLVASLVINFQSLRKYFVVIISLQFTVVWIYYNVVAVG